MMLFIGTANAQDAAEVRNGFLARAHETHLPQGITKNILTTADRLNADGGSGDLILLKATEGMAKGVPPGQIEATVRHYADDLRKAEKTTGATLPPNATVGAKRRALLESAQQIHRAEEKVIKPKRERAKKPKVERPSKKPREHRIERPKRERIDRHPRPERSIREHHRGRR